jgi:hypothetical protein
MNSSGTTIANSMTVQDLIDRVNSKHEGVSLDETRRRRIERKVLELRAFEEFQARYSFVIGVSAYAIWDTPDYDQSVSNVTEEFMEWMEENIHHGSDCTVYEGTPYLSFNDLNDAVHLKLRWN